MGIASYFLITQVQCRLDGGHTVTPPNVHQKKPPFPLAVYLPQNLLVIQILTNPRRLLLNVYKVCTYCMHYARNASVSLIRTKIYIV